MPLPRWDIFFCHLVPFPDSSDACPVAESLCAKTNPQPPVKSGHVLPQPAVCTLQSAFSNTCVSMCSQTNAAGGCAACRAWHGWMEEEFG